jgi:hypothetical protein
LDETSAVVGVVFTGPILMDRANWYQADVSLKGATALDVPSNSNLYSFKTVSGQGKI